MAPMPKMLVAPETLEGLVVIPFEKPLYRDLDIIYPRDRPLAGGRAGAHGASASGVAAEVRRSSRSGRSSRRDRRLLRCRLPRAPARPIQ